MEGQQVLFKGNMQTLPSLVCRYCAIRKPLWSHVTVRRIYIRVRVSNLSSPSIIYGLASQCYRASA